MHLIFSLMFARNLFPEMQELCGCNQYQSISTGMVNFRFRSAEVVDTFCYS